MACNKCGAVAKVKCNKRIEKLKKSDEWTNLASECKKLCDTEGKESKKKGCTMGGTKGDFYNIVNGECEDDYFKDDSGVTHARGKVECSVQIDCWCREPPKTETTDNGTPKDAGTIYPGGY